MNNFIVYALPRSRSYWISKFLQHGDWICAHDQARLLRGMDDARSWFAQEYVGTVETGAAPWWRIQQNICPTARVAVIRRDPGEVIESVMRWPLPLDRAIITRNIHQLDRKLDDIERNMPQALRLTYDDLRDEQACADLFEFCLDEPHDHAWWAALAPINLQINVRASLRYSLAHQAQHRRLMENANAEVRRLAFKRHKPATHEDFVIDEEPFETFFKDGVHLFREHCVLVGEPPDEYLHKNLSLARKLAESGMVQIVTARSNGKMFGYVTTMLSPDLEHDDQNCHTAHQLNFYVSPDARGLGMRLQRESLRRIEARGGRWRVVGRAGPRGDGPRMGTVWKRLGLEPDGQLWSTVFGEAT